MAESNRERMEFDVLIVGAGPAGLSAAIRLRQLARDAGDDEFSVCVIEKGSEVGAHILSGAVIEPRALDELLPDWRELGAPLHTPATDDAFLYLTAHRAQRLPTPAPMHNRGNYIVSLGNVCRWLAEQAEAASAEVFAGFPGAEVLYDEQGAVRGVATGDMGLQQDGTPGPNHEPGVELVARQTLFAEGCRGSLTRQVTERYGLAAESSPQTYGLGIKELWEVEPSRHRAGRVVHTVGWPLDRRTYGGGWLYHLEDGLVSVGFVVGLDYRNPYLSPFQEMQRFKTHPAIRDVFEGGRRVAYGARTLVEGGYQSLPRLSFPGGLLIGDSAGFLNVPKIKGTHTAMKSGMVAAEAVFEALAGEREQVAREVADYPGRLQNSWLWDELYRARNIRPAMARWGLWGGLAYAALDTYVLRGRAPWTLPNHADHEQTEPAADHETPDYPRMDNALTFDRLSSVYLSNTNHEEDQPCHLQLKDPHVPLTVNLARYDAPEQYYCPAGVYEIIHDADSKPRLQINAQNCVHCKACDIKDPTQNIVWTVPQGGDGPNYPNM
jgi:electron-transferring-flavoprotein dehydrogenase